MKMLLAFILPLPVIMFFFLISRRIHKNMGYVGRMMLNLLFALIISLSIISAFLWINKEDFKKFRTMKADHFKSGAVAGGIKSLQLSPQTVSVNAEAILFHLALPEGATFAEGLPFYLSFVSDMPEVIKIEKPVYTAPCEFVSVPIRIREGKAEIRIEAKIFYTLTGNRGQYFFKKIVNLKLPVYINETGNESITVLYGFVRAGKYM
jgi:hypothetical protein